MCGSSNFEQPAGKGRGETGETRGGGRARGEVCCERSGIRASSSRFESAHTGSKEASAHQLYGPALPGFRRLRVLRSNNLNVLASFK